MTAPNVQPTAASGKPPRSHAATSLASPDWATILMRLDASHLHALPTQRRNEVMQHALQATRIQLALRAAEDDLDHYPRESIPWHAARQIVRAAQRRQERALRALGFCLDGRLVGIVPAPDWESERPLECALMRNGAPDALLDAIRTATDDHFGGQRDIKVECLLWDAIAGADFDVGTPNSNPRGPDPLGPNLPSALVRRLRALSARSNGWAHVPAGGRDFAFVELEGWYRLHAGYVEQPTARYATSAQVETLQSATSAAA